MSKVPILTITDKAAARIKHLLSLRKAKAEGIKVKVESGGCSGKRYNIVYADEIKPYDEVIEHRGIKVIIEPTAIISLFGTNMDYVEEQFHEGFVFNNPNEKGRCGCGESFNT